MLNWTFHQLAGFLPRRSSAASGPAKAASQPVRVPAALATSVVSNDQLEARRAEALRSMFPKLSNWFASRYAALSVNEINDYLAQASNVTDLEQRIRVVQQQRHFS